MRESGMQRPTSAIILTSCVVIQTLLWWRLKPFSLVSALGTEIEGILKRVDSTAQSNSVSVEEGRSMSKLLVPSALSLLVLCLMGGSKGSTKPDEE